jgi:hypothetical protein
LPLVACFGWVSTMACLGLGPDYILCCLNTLFSILLKDRAPAILLLQKENFAIGSQSTRFDHYKRKTILLKNKMKDRKDVFLHIYGEKK